MGAASPITLAELNQQQPWGGDPACAVARLQNPLNLRASAIPFDAMLLSWGSRSVINLTDNTLAE